MNDQRSYGMLGPGASRFKRKERESHYQARRPPPPPPPPPAPPRATVTASKTMRTSKGSKATEITKSSNKLLAGCMAYEFLTKGTLLGHKFDSDHRSNTESDAKKKLKSNETYKEITSLLMTKNDKGVHIPGIVNPTELARWIQM